MGEENSNIDLTTDPEFVSLDCHIRTAIKDCAICYSWNPYENSDIETLAYDKFSMTFYAGVDTKIRTAYIVFRGTDSSLDWIKNFLFLPPLPLLHPVAHPLFVLEWKTRKHIIINWLLKHRQAYDEIIVTGHSLGGALATICAYDLSKYCKNDIRFNIKKVITIGAPRVYTLLSRKYVDKQLPGKIIRLIHKHDAVPKLPPRLIGYRHVGEEWKFKSDLYGSRITIPQSSLEQFIGNLLYYATGGPLTEWIDRKVGDGMGIQLLILVLVAMGYVGQMFLNIIYLASIASVFFLGVLGIALAAKSHNSAIYAASKPTITMFEELSKIGLAAMCRDAPVKTLENGKTVVSVDFDFPEMGDKKQQQAFFIAFKEYFKEHIFERAVKYGPYLTGEPPELPTWRVANYDLQRFQNACLYLAALGYSATEVDDIVNGKAFARPANWKRYYDYTSMHAARASTGTKPPQQGDQSNEGTTKALLS